MAFLHTTGDFLVEAEFDGLYEFLVNGGSWLGIHSGVLTPSSLARYSRWVATGLLSCNSRGLLECHAALVYHSCRVSGKKSPSREHASTPQLLTCRKHSSSSTPAPQTGHAPTCRKNATPQVSLPSPQARVVSTQPAEPRRRRQHPQRHHNHPGPDPPIHRRPAHEPQPHGRVVLVQGQRRPVARVHRPRHPERDVP